MNIKRMIVSIVLTFATAVSATRAQDLVKDLTDGGQQIAGAVASGVVNTVLDRYASGGNKLESVTFDSTVNAGVISSSVASTTNVGSLRIRSSQVQGPLTMKTRVNAASITSAVGSSALVGSATITGSTIRGQVAIDASVNVGVVSASVLSRTAVANVTVRDTVLNGPLSFKANVNAATITSTVGSETTVASLDL